MHRSPGSKTVNAISGISKSERSHPSCACRFHGCSAKRKSRHRFGADFGLRFQTFGGFAPGLLLVASWDMPKKAAENPSPLTSSPAERLARLLSANSGICYYQDLPDKEFPDVKCSIYGAPKTNELFVRLSNGRVSVVAVAPSPVIFPTMTDRIFGMDAADHAVAFALADRLWESNRAVLAGR